MNPFFTYYGGKWRAAPHYPPPEHGFIVEPFAGAAGYALRYPEKRVILVEKSPVVAALWRWLIEAPESEIEGLPLDVPAAGVVIEGDYRAAPDVEATWFVDPPYEAAGRLYPCSSRDIDYKALATWCYCRRGQVLVCENEGAAWLPFQPFMVAKSTEGRHGKGQSRESLFIMTGLL